MLDSLIFAMSLCQRCAYIDFSVAYRRECLCMSGPLAGIVVREIGVLYELQTLDTLTDNNVDRNQ